MRKVIKLINLPADDRVLVLQAAALLLICRVGLYLLRFESLKSWAARAKKTEKTKRCISVSKLMWAAKMAARNMPKSTCLVRALAASRLLAQNGYSSTLRIGVKRSEGLFEAHAWLEHGGRAIIGSGEAPHFTPLREDRHGRA
jgi:hypothetical protein